MSIAFVGSVCSYCLQILGTKCLEGYLVKKKKKFFVFQTVFEEYQKLAGKSIEDSIKSETRGSLEDAMLAIGK